MIYVQGDGQWVAMSKCTQRWRYALYGDQLDAELAAAKRCGAECFGPNHHKVWRLIEPERTTPKSQPKLSADETASFWEGRLGVDGL